MYQYSLPTSPEGRSVLLFVFVFVTCLFALCQWLFHSLSLSSLRKPGDVPTMIREKKNSDPQRCYDSRNTIFNLPHIIKEAYCHRNK
jgi:hypothetical protein